ncbi:hypothetical protein [Saccharopolyspora sp. NPDC050642]|uniref:hypothetical protein n=1 Tax=Saccharopolyspora sp. NPDC050642 TaxID=3157099 RepID=UPI0033CD83B6
MTQTDHAADPRPHQERQRILDDLVVAQVLTGRPGRTGFPPVAVSGAGQEPAEDDRSRSGSRELVPRAVIGHRVGPPGPAGGLR